MDIGSSMMFYILLEFETKNKKQKYSFLWKPKGKWFHYFLWVIFAFNIKREIINVLDFFLSFLKKYENKKVHNMISLMLNPRCLKVLI